MPGMLSRIDLRIEADDEAAGLLDAVRAALPDGVSLEAVGTRSDTMTGMIAAFDVNLTALSLLALIFGLPASSAIVVLAAGGLALRARRRPVVSGVEELVGARGEVTRVGKDGTWARVRGARWQVTSAATLEPGQRVRVRALRGLTLDVQPESEARLQGGEP